MNKTTMHKTVLIGLDGIPFSVMDNLFAIGRELDHANIAIEQKEKFASLAVLFENALTRLHP